MRVHDVVIRPIITEKSMGLAGKDKYTFAVAKSATKEQVKEAVEKLFKVTVMSVATMVAKGGSIRTGLKRVELKNQPWKKAIVTVKKGDKIGVFEIGA